MEHMGVGQVKALFVLPVLLMLIVAAAYWGIPQRETVRFTPSAAIPANPMTGLALPARAPCDSAYDVRLAWVQATWRELEPEMDAYAFDAFDAQIQLEAWRARGAKLIFRLVIDTPDAQACPSYLLPEGETDAAPDYSDPFFQERHRMLLSQIRRRYGQDIAYVEVGSLGQDGSWIGTDAAPMPMTDVTSIYLWQYAAEFSQNLVLAPAPYREARLSGMGYYQPDLTDQSAAWDWLNMLRFGAFDAEMGIRLRPDTSAGHACPTGAWLSEMGEIDAALLRRLQDVQASYLCVSLADWEAAEALTPFLGYRYWVRQAQWNQTVRRDYSLYVDIAMENDGVAPVMGQYALRLALLSPQGDVVHSEPVDTDPHQWLPGTTTLRGRITVPYYLPVGDYTLAAGLCEEDAHTPTLAFAMDCPRKDLWALLGHVTVE